VDVWLVDVDDAPAAHHAALCLPPAERRRLSARAEPHRRHALCANAALRILAARAAGGVLPLPQLGHDPRGKPVLAGRHPLQLSLSHAAGHAAVALGAAGPVGVDIEDCAPLPDRERFARGILADGERRDWQGLPDAARDTAVAAAFTRKEAVLKALGTGLAGGLRQVATDLRTAPPGGGAVLLRGLPDGAGAAADWTVVDLAAVPEGLRGAVAVRAPGAAVREHRTTIGELLRLARPNGPEEEETAP
jgi:4'-phosphopantetheinyl transferase